MATLSQPKGNGSVGSHRHQSSSHTTQHNGESPDEWSLSNYEMAGEIGVGAYGIVYRAKDLEHNGRFVALKCLRVQNTEEGMPLSTVREIALLKQLDLYEHPNIVRLLDICIGGRTAQETRLTLVFEYIDQDLDTYLKKAPQPGLQAEVIRDIMEQLLKGVDFLHSNRVIHRDLKPQNILITHDHKVKLADFGLARVYNTDMALTAVVVTLWYRAPEVLLQDSYATPVDLWSVGCIFAELYKRHPLFRGSGDIHQLNEIFDFIGLPSNEDWPANVALPLSSFRYRPSVLPHEVVPEIDGLASDFLLKLLTFKPDKRISAASALEDMYFNEDLHPHHHLSSMRKFDLGWNTEVTCSGFIPRGILTSIPLPETSVTRSSSESSFRRLPYANFITNSTTASTSNQSAFVPCVTSENSEAVPTAHSSADSKCDGSTSASRRS